MKLSGFLVFLSIVLSVYASVNLYIFVRGWQVVPKDSLLRTIYVVVFLFFSLSYIIGRFSERISISAESSLFVWTGSFWLALMAYLFLFILFIDVIRVFNHFLNFFPQFLTTASAGYGKAKLVTAVSVLGISIIIVAAGYFNACIPKINRVEINIAKSVKNMQSLHIVMASDIHLGTIVSNSRLEKLVTSINGLNPDVILLAGDIVDEDLAPVIKNNLGELLVKLKSKYGTYAVTGNHEYIGGVKEAVKYLTEHKITILRDESVKIADSFYIAGREDRSASRFYEKKRKPLQEILSDTELRLPVIMMDHQPFELQEAQNAGVDLQLSGHTHHGQLWPFNFITSAIFELSYGYLQKGSTHYYVSCGYGTWGPPVRTSARPEIADIKINFGR